MNEITFTLAKLFISSQQKTYIFYTKKLRQNTKNSSWILFFYFSFEASRMKPKYDDNLCKQSQCCKCFSSHPQKNTNMLYYYYLISQLRIFKYSKISLPSVYLIVNMIILSLQWWDLQNFFNQVLKIFGNLKSLNVVNVSN
jgi:hypothetical protein